MNFRTLLVAAAIWGAFAPASQAGIITHTGNTTTAPTYNRALPDLTGVDTGATAVHYDSYSFTVGTAGTYTFLSTGLFDTMAFLYAPAFSASTPLVNAKAGNDDLVSASTSGFTYDLATGVTYTLVTTGYGNSDAGFFSDTIGGPGSISALAPGSGAGTPNILTYTGDTSAAPTFDRPYEDLSAISDFGTDVNYDAFTFHVGTSGFYDFLTTGTYDTMAFLYSPSFDPTQGLTGVMAGNDDLVSFNTSGFRYELTAGVDYTLVTTAYANGASGAFSNTISGPGAIIPPATVPEPGVVPLMLAGFGAIGWTVRRRKA